MLYSSEKFLVHSYQNKQQDGSGQKNTNVAVDYKIRTSRKHLYNIQSSRMHQPPSNKAADSPSNL